MEKDNIDDEKLAHLERLFKQIFSNLGRNQNYWPKTYKLKYIRKLKVDLKIKKIDLPLSIIEENDVNKIFEKAIKYDTSLKIFEIFFKRYEKYGRKEVKTIDASSYIDKDIVLKQDQSLEYSFNNSEEWEVINLQETNDKATIILGKSAFSPITAELKRSDFANDDEWNAIINATNRKTKEGVQTLSKVQIRAVIPKRTILSMNFDKKEKILEIAHDNFEVDKEGKKIKEVEKYSELEKAYDKAFEQFDIPDEKLAELKYTIKESKNNIFYNVEISDLQKYSNDDMIIVFSTQDFFVKSELFDELDEDIRSRLNNIAVNEIEKEAKNYYNEKGKLTGFFEDYKRFDIHRTDISGNLIAKSIKNESLVDQRSFHAYAILIRDKNDYDESKEEFTGHYKDKAIEHISFEYDFDDGCLDIKNSNYSEVMHETLISRICELYKKTQPSFTAN